MTGSSDTFARVWLIFSSLVVLNLLKPTAFSLVFLVFPIVSLLKINLDLLTSNFLYLLSSSSEF